MNTARIPTAHPRGLVVLRGGLDGDGGDGDDWEDFCRRIGWQTDVPSPDPDFERRIAERLAAGATAPDNVIDLDLARDARQPAAREGDLSFEEAIRRSFVRRVLAASASEPPQSGPRLRSDLVLEPPPAAAMSPLAPFDGEGAAQADFGPDTDGDRLRRGWHVAGAAAAALALAAGVALVLARLSVFGPGAPEASIAAPLADVAVASTADARAVAPTDSARLDAEPPDVAQERPAPTDDPTATPAPGPTAPRVRPRHPRDTRPVPPGTRVAHRSPEDRPTRRALTVDHSSTPDPREGAFAMGAGASFGARGPFGGGAHPAVAGTLGADPRAAIDPTAPWGAAALSRIAYSSADNAAPAGGNTGSGVWSGALPSAEIARAERASVANASWSLAGPGNRWVGASMTPSLPAFAQTNIGVMLQLDLGKALGKL